MSDIAPVIEMFQARIREELPELATSAGTATPDGFGNFTLLDVPCPSSPKRCRLGVLYRGDCFEIAFSVVEARGPAEHQVIITSDSAGAVTATIDFLRGVLSDRMLVDIFRYRILWFQPYHLAFFREASRHPRGRIVETLRWTANGKVKDVC
jgi:hypothetical protein